MDYKTDDIDFGRIAMLMDVVAKVSTVAPMNTSISSAAMAELKDINEELAQRAAKAGAEKLKEDQARAAKLTQENQRRADEEAAEAERLKSRPQMKPINVMPGEPNELAEAEARLKAQDPRNPNPRDPDNFDEGEDHLGERRV